MPTTLNPITWSLDGWTGNTRDDYGVEWYVETTDGWWNGPGVRTGLTAREDAHGSFPSRMLRESRLVTLSGSGFATDNYGADTARDVLNGLCTGDDEELYPLTVAEPLGERTADVILAGPPRIELTSRREFVWQLQLVAPDPRKYGPWLEVPIALATPGSGGLDASGAGLDASSPGLAAGTGPEGGSAKIQAAGNAPTGPLLDLLGPLPDTTIRVPELNVDMVYTDPIASGQVVRINSDEFDALGARARSATLNGQARDQFLGLAQGRWPVITKGSTTTWFLTSTGADPAARLTVRHRPAWW